MLRHLSKIGILYLCFLLVSCSSNTENTVDFNYFITASADINPDIEGRPSSVIVRIYQLTNKINFENASYDALFESNHNALGTEYINLDEYLIDPNTRKEVELKISENAKYIGVVVGYRSTDMVTWRTIKAVPEGSFWRNSGIEFKIDKLSVRVVEI
ncbi:type VI secretion system lipoprotein TssJ [Paraglaciecola arctica]|uniref:Type VI secretion system protein VasD n=1 Tax=Paraglaciecola arctica BSs20135 TaxID=493475 RepID=K6YU66_9ALTE|nr:type VI secretion system lipoprotein TssJ [Paraglaciecola arctica]GAC21717.1 type VI secretion system protein VasD [Paraglaciecola arctica BSs20135]|tara:strand:+ start:114 stop:584 length:471 start_codon:yes stop_codon:yes gene_type:complete